MRAVLCAVLSDTPASTRSLYAPPYTASNIFFPTPVAIPAEKPVPAPIAFPASGTTEPAIAPAAAPTPAYITVSSSVRLATC